MYRQKHSKEYVAYLNSSEWRSRRLAKLEQAKRRCEVCGETEGLQVHHQSYKDLGHERSDDLIVLCQACHSEADILRAKGGRVTKKAKHRIRDLVPFLKPESFKCPICHGDLVRSSFEGLKYCPRCEKTFKEKILRR